VVWQRGTRGKVGSNDKEKPHTGRKKGKENIRWEGMKYETLIKSPGGREGQPIMPR